MLGGPGFSPGARDFAAVDELVVAASSFHTKPLRRFLQTADRYHVLGLSLPRDRLFEGNRRSLDEVDMSNGGSRRSAKPRVTGLLKAAPAERAFPCGTGWAGKAPRRTTRPTATSRAVDRAVLEHYSRPSGLPLILGSVAGASPSLP